MFLGLCRHARNGTFVRNHLACGEFYQCIDEEPLRRVCQEGLWYNHNQQRCTPPYTVYCVLDEIICDDVESGNRIRSPSSCSDYILCSQGFPFPFRCQPDHYFFDESIGSCEPPELVECELNVTVPPRNECDGQPDFSLAASLENCQTYLVCYNNDILFEMECPEGQVFDPETQVCGEEFECLYGK